MQQLELPLGDRSRDRLNHPPDPAQTSTPATPPNVTTLKVTNVSSVPQRSPFRYAGGKTWLVPQVRQWLAAYGGPGKELLEPFTGGGIVGLTAVFENWVDRVTFMEKDEGVAAVWQVILNGGAADLADRIMQFQLTPDNARAILTAADSTPTAAQSLDSLAFATLVKNRVSHGGILANGAGLVKRGEKNKGIGSRWYPETLKKRILAIDALKHRIRFIPGDMFNLWSHYPHTDQTLYFLDPPYLKASRRLYRHATIDHTQLFQWAAQVQGSVLMSYDNAAEVQCMAVAHGLRTHPIAMKNTHHAHKTELLISQNFRWLSPI